MERENTSPEAEPLLGGLAQAGAGASAAALPSLDVNRGDLALHVLTQPGAGDRIMSFLGGTRAKDPVTAEPKLYYFGKSYQQQQKLEVAKDLVHMGWVCHGMSAYRQSMDATVEPARESRYVRPGRMTEDQTACCKYTCVASTLLAIGLLSIGFNVDNAGVAVVLGLISSFAAMVSCASWWAGVDSLAGAAVLTTPETATFRNFQEIQPQSEPYMTLGSDAV